MFPEKKATLKIQSGFLKHLELKKI